MRAHVREWWDGLGGTRSDRIWGSAETLIVYSAIACAILGVVLGLIFGWSPD